MGKAILAAIVTFVAGYIGMVVGLEFLGGWVEFGVLVAVCVMGAFIIYFNDGVVHCKCRRKFPKNLLN